MMSFVAFAERKMIFCNSSSGKKEEIIIRIGQPYWREVGVYAACPIEINGIYGRISDICNDDLLSSLESALWTLDSMLLDIAKEGDLCFITGEKYFSNFDIMSKERKS